MLKVLHGDRVLAKPDGEYRGKPEATIVEVVERRTNKLVGRFLKERGAFIVVPEDQRIKHDIIIPASDMSGAEHGQVVSVEIVQQPTRQDRKSVEKGKSVSVRVDLGGRRSIKKKKNN